MPGKRRICLTHRITEYDNRSVDPERREAFRGIFYY